MSETSRDVFTVRLPLDLAERIKAAAEKDYVSMNAIITLALRAHFYNEAPK